MSDNGRPLPKFGEWDVNDPASAEGFTVIFNKARDEKKTGGSTGGSDSPAELPTGKQEGYLATKPNTKKWLCCIQPSPTQS
ncbi:RPM1-interacting protein 4-like [Asparagus officinalis]|uniref:RPM1-interacting protein 4-like n=1 Tax=Asparagus officinalis TaxID=4686 RepID=UPI00098DF706|nr:RPM1-interacting protein 4-like [Asparagus officinalis]